MTPLAPRILRNVAEAVDMLNNASYAERLIFLINGGAFLLSASTDFCGSLM